MKTVYTHGAIYANTPAHQPARIVYVGEQPPFMEVAQGGQWVRACPGADVWFRPVRYVPLPVMAIVNQEKEPCQET